MNRALREKRAPKCILTGGPSGLAGAHKKFPLIKINTDYNYRFL
jgi:hypothetical protein